MRRSLMILAGALLVAMILPAAVAAKPKPTGTYSVPVAGIVDGGGALAGSLEINRFAQRAGSLVALGTLTGTLTSPTGATSNVTKSVALPAAITGGTCDILHLTLGPLDLNVLGLVVHLDRVVLDITAVQAPGNLLGNLLCAVAGLLDGTGPLSGITQLLNQILAILQGIGL